MRCSSNHSLDELSLAQSHREELQVMIDLLLIAVLFLLLNPLSKEGKYKEIERQQAMRRAMNRLQEKYRSQHQPPLRYTKS
jgi:hypothetical protein